MSASDGGGGGEPSEPSAGPPARVLVVDDEDVMRKAWRRILRPPEFEVETAARAAEALAALERTVFEVVVLDVVMPGMTGMEALPVIKQRWPDVEVVMMTAYGGDDAAAQAARLGARELLSKPFDSIDRAAQAVRRAVVYQRARARALADR